LCVFLVRVFLCVCLCVCVTEIVCHINKIEIGKIRNLWFIRKSACNEESLNESGRHSHGKYTLKLYMYSDNPLYFDAMCIICLEVGHGESSSENNQCEVLVEAKCFSNKCQCTSSFYYHGRRCVGNIGMYRVYISNIIFSAIFSARLFILASVKEINY